MYFAKTICARLSCKHSRANLLPFAPPLSRALSFSVSLAIVLREGTSIRGSFERATSPLPYETLFLYIHIHTRVPIRKGRENGHEFSSTKIVSLALAPLAPFSRHVTLVVHTNRSFSIVSANYSSNSPSFSSCQHRELKRGSFEKIVNALR